MEIKLTGVTASLALIALTTLPVYVAAKLLDARNGTMLRASLVVIVGGILAWMGASISDDSTYGVLLGVAGFALAALFILGLTPLRAVLATILAAAFSLLVAMSLPSMFSSILPSLTVDDASVEGESEPESQGT